ncbi:hypothetical protein [Sphingobium yanoikuyae]|uniref:phage tail assembly chaperone n=1 Tax=Sphingobium yanoikuyae TaxID=13690 RepID=UPI0028A78453|nr:hypothetical protein [Sphingobium yanoikuyae]
MKAGQKLLREAAAQPDNPFYHAQLANAPKQEHPFYYDAFWNLHTERQVGMAQGPIPDSAIKAYAADPELQLTNRERWAFRDIIRAMDNTYLNITAETAKTSTKAGKKGR